MVAIGSRRHDRRVSYDSCCRVVESRDHRLRIPAGQTDRYPNCCLEGLGITVKFSE